MKIQNILNLVLPVALLTIGAVPAHARFVTIMATTTNQTNQITVESYETVKVVTFYDYAGWAGSHVTIRKGDAIIQASPGYYGTTFSMGSSYNPVTQQPSSLGPLPFVLTGPATISLETWSCCDRSQSGPAVLTMEITPEAYPPDKAITLAPGTGGAQVTLQSSTNLLNWDTATNGTYSSPPAATFFRIKADRIP